MSSTGLEGHWRRSRAQDVHPESAMSLGKAVTLCAPCSVCGWDTVLGALIEQRQGAGNGGTRLCPREGISSLIPYNELLRSQC